MWWIAHNMWWERIWRIKFIVCCFLRFPHEENLWKGFSFFHMVTEFAKSEIFQNERLMLLSLRFFYTFEHWTFPQIFLYSYLVEKKISLRYLLLCFNFSFILDQTFEIKQLKRKKLKQKKKIVEKKLIIFSNKKCILLELTLIKWI